jgi:hypothetical protein
MDKKSSNKFFAYSSGSTSVSEGQYPSVMQLKNPVYNSMGNKNSTNLNSAQPLNVNDAIASTMLDNSSSYSNIDISTSLSNQSRLGSLHVLTDKQNVINPLKAIDGSKKVSSKSNGNFSYFDELLVNTRNTFFS